MTSEEQIEEILIESHSYGVRSEVIEQASKIMGSNPKLSKVDVYEQAFKLVMENYGEYQ